MRRQNAENRKRKAEEKRRAVTLIEVLMSIMILSIGIISVATLFPAAILRSVQATQLTNATILRFNVEAFIDVELGIVLDPDKPPNVALVEHVGENYIVDPLGWNRILDHPNFGDLQPVFGNDGNDGNEMPVLGSNVRNLARYSGLLSRFDADQIFNDDGTLTVSQARAIALRNALNAVTLPDSWVLHYEGAPERSTLTSVTLAAEDLPGVIDLNQLRDIINSNVPVRIVLFNDIGRSSQVRPLTSIGVDVINDTISWTDRLPSIGYEMQPPLSFPGVGTISRVRIEKQEIRYTWLLTVRNNDSGVASVDVVVMFRRPDPPVGETRYGSASGDPADNVFIQDSRTATIGWRVGDKPAIKKGGFILDAQNARWYRIQNITADDAAGTAVLQLEEPAFANGNAAIVIPGVIEVYPIDNKVQL